MGKTRTPELPVGDPAHVAPKGLGHSVDRVTCRWQHPGVVTRRVRSRNGRGSLQNLVGGWATRLKNMKINWEDYSQYMEK